MFNTIDLTFKLKDLLTIIWPDRAKPDLRIPREYAFVWQGRMALESTPKLAASINLVVRAENNR